MKSLKHIFEQESMNPTSPTPGQKTVRELAGKSNVPKVPQNEPQSEPLTPSLSQSTNGEEVPSEGKIQGCVQTAENALTALLSAKNDTYPANIGKALLRASQALQSCVKQSSGMSKSEQDEAATKIGEMLQKYLK